MYIGWLERFLVVTAILVAVSVNGRADSYGKVHRKISGVERTICRIFPHRHSAQYWAGGSRRVGPCEALVRNNVFKVITMFCHSRVGKTTTEVAFEFHSVVLEPTSEIPTSGFDGEFVGWRLGIWRCLKHRLNGFPRALTDPFESMWAHPRQPRLGRAPQRWRPAPS